MPDEIKPEVIEWLISEINRLKQKIKEKGEEAKLQDIKMEEVTKDEELIEAGKVKPNVWKELDEEKKRLLLEGLNRILDALKNLDGEARPSPPDEAHFSLPLFLDDDDGPEDPAHIMYNQHASNNAIRMMVVFGFVITSLLFWGILNYWDAATRGCPPPQTDANQTDTNQTAGNQTDEAGKKDGVPSAVPAIPVATDQSDKDVKNRKNEPPAKVENVVTERSILIMVMLLGALGGMLQYLGSISKYIGNRQLKRSWVVYYLTMPFIGAGLAPVTYLLLRIGVLSTGAPADGGGSTASYMNLNGIYAFAVLTGMFAKSATAKLSEVFQTLFNTKEPPTKDALKSTMTVGQ